MQRRIVSPIEALRVVAENVSSLEVQGQSVDDVHGAYLAEPVLLDAAPIARCAGVDGIALVNGYALRGDFAGGDFRVRSRRLESEAGKTLPEEPSEESGPPVFERLETGDALAAGADRMLPIDAVTLVGTAMARVDAASIPLAGSGVAFYSDGGIELAAGTPLTSRLRALLLSRGVREVRVRPAWRVTLATVGSEVTDLLALEEGGSRQVGDLNAYWLSEAIAGLHFACEPLGTVPDSPGELGELLRRAQRSGSKSVILTGGIGQGVSDRTVEALQSGPFHIFFEGVAMRPGSGFLFARGMGLEVFALSGAPLEAALAFDLFVVPAFLKARGAPERVWDWSREPQSYPLSATAQAGRAGENTEWRAVAISDDPAPPLAGLRDPRGSAPGADFSLFQPGIPAQEAWEIHSPPDGLEARKYLVQSTGQISH